MRLCHDCGKRSMHASDYCRLCKAERRRAYFQERYEFRDFTPAQIESRYLRAHLSKRPWLNALRVRQEAA